MKSKNLTKLIKNYNLTPNSAPDLDVWQLFLLDLDNLNINVEQKLNNLRQHTLSSHKAVTLGKLIGGISHDINNPLAVIQLRSEQLLEMVANQDLQTEYFTKSLAGVTRASQKIADIVTTVRSIMTHDTNQLPNFCSLNTIIEQAVNLHRHKFARADISLEVEPACDVVVEFVAPELSNILFYLLDNAFDAVVNASEKWVRIQIGKTDTDFFVTITDSGSGISPADKAQIMTSFFSTKNEALNAGIGLHLAQNVLTKHGGRIEVIEGVINTQFKITCPLTQATPVTNA